MVLPVIDEDKGVGVQSLLLRFSISSRFTYNNGVCVHTPDVIKNENQRIVYLEDGRDEFIRKEDMDAQLPTLAWPSFCKIFLKQNRHLYELTRAEIEGIAEG